MQVVFDRASRRTGRYMKFIGFHTSKQCEPATDRPNITVYLLESWGSYPVYGEDSEYRVKATEDICRAEAARLGFSVVVIRAGLHNKRNQHAVNGTELVGALPATRASQFTG